MFVENILKVTLLDKSLIIQKFLMKSLLTIFFLFPLWGNSQLQPQALIIKGQLSNCPEKLLKIFFRDRNGLEYTDTLKLDNSGKFYLKTYKVKSPHIASIQKNNIQINDFFVAPGYNLTITGEGKDYLTLLKTTSIKGQGSESNRYRHILHAMLIKRMDKTNWLDLNENELLKYLEQKQKLEDSIRSIVFDKRTKEDKYFTYFGKIVELDIQFSKLKMLLSYVNNHNYTYDSTISFVNKNFDNKVLAKIYRKEYLVSEEYRDLMTTDWLDYIVNLDIKMDTGLKDRKDYKLTKIRSEYQGKIRDYVLFKKMREAIEISKTLKQINDNKANYESTIALIDFQAYKKMLIKTMDEKERDLMRTQIGALAPNFRLKDSSGKFYQLDDFKGKIVYIDLWASWCGPCRAETPDLKILYETYKNNEKIKFLSIAVHDGIDDWKKAIVEDKTEWLQLLDEDGFVEKSYIASSIPKFILIDKNGRFIDMDAPRPSNKEAINALLNKEINKQRD